MRLKSRLLITALSVGSLLLIAACSMRYSCFLVYFISEYRGSFT